MSEGEGAVYNATLVERVDIGPRQAVFRVKPDGALPEFKAGQFMVLGLTWAEPRVQEATPEEEPEPDKANRLIRRAYSIASGAHDHEVLEFYISMVSSGILTPRLFHLKPGARLFLGPKATGLFTLERIPAGKNLLMVSTGTGLAPYMSMVRTQALGEGCPIRPMAILHGASYSWDLGYRNELELLAHACERFRYLPVISRPTEDKGWTGKVGRLGGWLSRPDLDKEVGFSLAPEETHILLCGHPGMVEEATTILTGQGHVLEEKGRPGNLHREKYW